MGEVRSASFGGLSAEDARRAIRKGLGRGLMYVRATGGADVLDVIRGAYTTDYAYDSDVEESRATYTVELAEAAGDLEKLRHTVFTELLSTGNVRQAWYLAELAATLGEQGDDAARQTLRDAFEHHLAAGRVVGACEILDFEGTAGLIWLAERIGHDLSKVEVWRPQSLFDEGTDEGRDESAIAKMEHAARSNVNIRRFLETARAVVQRKLDSPDTAVPQSWIGVQSLAEALIDSGNGYEARRLIQRWRREAIEEELEACARALVAEERTTYFDVIGTAFAYKRFPLEPAELFAVARSSNKTMSFRAQCILANIEDQRIRELAIELIVSGNVCGSTLDLFTMNYQPGDHKVIESALATIQDSDEFLVHSCGLDLFHILGKRQEIPKEAGLVRDAESRALWNWLYRHTPCSYCRHDAVQEMIRLRYADRSLLEECLHDSDLRSRESARTALTMNPE